MQVYISGPITGNEDYEQKFKVREAALKTAGHIPVNPINIGKRVKKSNWGHEPSKEEYMRADIKALLDCQGISFLDGWEKSEGCIVEAEVAKACGIATIQVNLLSPSWG